MTNHIKQARKGLRCGSCVYLNTHLPSELELPKKERKTCSQKGYTAANEICSEFAPSYVQLVPVSSFVVDQNPVIDLLNVISDLPLSALPILSYLLAGAQNTAQRMEKAKLPFRFMQRVYYHYRGRGNYLSNYCWGYIVDTFVLERKVGLILLAKSGTLVLRINSDCLSSLLSEEDFFALREDFIAEKKIWDPEIDNNERRILKNSMSISSTNTKVPTLNAPPLDAAAKLGAFNKDLLLNAELDSLYKELGSKGIAEKTHFQELKKVQVEKLREDGSGRPRKFSFEFETESELEETETDSNSDISTSELDENVSPRTQPRFEEEGYDEDEI